jgi:hypothetical protein
VTREVYYDVSVPQGIRIETAEQLANIGIDPDYPADGEYYLANDIDLSVLWEKGETRFDVTPGTPYVWRSIGSTCKECGGPLTTTGSVHALPLTCQNRDCSLYQVSQPPFSGRFHGNGKTVSGLKLSGGTETDGYNGAMFIGLFGYINGAYIHGLTLEVANTAEDPRIAYNGDTSSAPSIAAVAAVARSSRINNITLRPGANAGLYVTAALVSSNTTTYTGGIAGRAYDTSLTNISSSLPVNIDGNGTQVVGGIAGETGGMISGAEMTGRITAVSAGINSNVAGICVGNPGNVPGGSTLAIRDCTVTMDEFTLEVAASGYPSLGASISGIGNAVTVADCSVDIGLIKLASNDTSSNGHPLSAGGISAQFTAGTIERCSARFDTLEVTAAENVKYGNVYVGGLAGNLGSGTTIGKVIDSYIETDGEISVYLPSAEGGYPYIGGLVGQGDVFRSNIAGGVNIDVTTGTIGIVYTGGLTGNGLAEYSFIGTLARHATLNVTKTNTTSTNTNRACIGGISGQAALTATQLFQYNYTFCDVTLITLSGSTAARGQSVGGLVGSVTGTVTGIVFAECYAVGNVTITNNSSGESTTKIFAGGIAAFGNNDEDLTISKCAALGTIKIDGSNSASAKIWRRIMYPTTDPANTKFENNITGIDTIQSGSPEGGLNTANGLYVANVTEDTFFGTGVGQLGWDREVWKWDEAAGYPVLK